MPTDTTTMISATEFLDDVPKNVAALTPDEFANELIRISRQYSGFMFGKAEFSERADERSYSLVQHLHEEANKLSSTPHIHLPVFAYSLGGVEPTYLVLVDRLGVYSSSRLDWYLVKGMDRAKTFEYEFVTTDSMKEFIGLVGDHFDVFVHNFMFSLLRAMRQGRENMTMQMAQTESAVSAMIARASKLSDLEEEVQKRERENDPTYGNWF